MSEPFETCRSVVYPKDCDIMGHMNTAAYVHFFDQASQHLLLLLGSDPSEPRKKNLGWADVKMTVEYTDEAKPGDLVIITSRPTRFGKSSISITHEMRNAATGRILATGTFVTVRFNLQSRRSAPLPSQVAIAASRFLEPNHES